MLLAKGADLVSFGHPVPRAVAPEPLRASLQVPCTCLGSHHDTGAGQLGPPTQVQVLARPTCARVEAAERSPQVRAHEDRTARRYEDLASRVVLALVQLSRFDELVDDTEVVSTHPYRCQAVRGVPHDEFRAGQACIGTVGLLQEELDGVRCEHDVVVADQDVGDLLDHFEPLVRRVGKPGPRRHPGEVRLGEQRGHPLGGRVVGTYVDHEHRQVRVTLRRQRDEGFVQPRRGTAGHDHRHHARRGQLWAHQRSRA